MCLGQNWKIESGCQVLIRDNNPVKLYRDNNPVKLYPDDAAVSSMSGASSASSGPSVWALINQYQLILLLPMLGTYLENNFEFYITEFELMSFDFDFMDFIEFPFIDPKVDVIDYQQPNKLFRNNGVESGSFIHNHYRFIKVILIVFICDMIFLLTKLIIIKLFKPKHQC